MNNFQRGALAALLIVTVGIAALAPAGIGFVVAARSERQQRVERLSVLADAALYRAEDITRRLSGALGEIGKVNEAPCSMSYLHALRQITLTHEQVRDAGAYDRDGRWQCSSLLGAVSAGTFDGLTLPPPDWRSPDGLSAWYGLARLPGGKESLVMGRDGFYITADPALYVDGIETGIAPEDRVAVINTEARRLIAGTPATDAAAVLAVYSQPPQWSDCAAIAVRQSASMPIAVIVSAPRETWRRRVRALPWGWLLGGVATGLACAGWLAFVVVRRVSPRGQLSDAVRRHQFIVAYQPIVDLATRRCVGAEALVRWKHHDRIVRPDHFIPLAEHGGLIQAITDQVLDTVLLELGDFLRRYADYYVSVNLSVPDLTTRRFLDVLGPAIAKQGVRPQQIRIEATERAFLDADAAKDVIDAFRRAGHAVYLDDFGTGYSSLSHLQSFRVDGLKIDKSFVDTIGQDAASSSVASHIIEMAATLDVQVIAEGIEREEQAAYLHARGAQSGQGWLFSPPLTAAEFIRYAGRTRGT
ncbi:EAL domain-containing protein [Caballeronia concitans]|uniref:cyclic-guanylate-specific phosphodiesterase n=1 Tax=Caballeronia concitans TaxID=1777133 RepID=A0A658R2X7_9BURK|nr:EAL domain-containing protein [Caballeronia concitans]KIG10310.1 diguanylate phosphodiesterase with integral membrane sensor [Burkholderia sp. MR1]SAL44532.1 diguanylate cyclase/phosphodiesterase with PAS/PAC sensor(s) [Caballeronia concitans]